MPIRASKRSAEWWLNRVDQCWASKEQTYKADEKEEAKSMCPDYGLFGKGLAGGLLVEAGAAGGRLVEVVEGAAAGRPSLVRS